MLSREYLYGRRCVLDLIQILDQLDWRAAARAPVYLDGPMGGLLLTWTVLRGERGFVLTCLEEMGVDMWGLTRDVDELIRRRKGTAGPHAPLDPSTAGFHYKLDGLVWEWLDLAAEQSLLLGHRHLGVEHLLLAIAVRGDPDLAPILARHGLDSQRLRAEFAAALERRGPAEVTEVSEPRPAGLLGAGWDSPATGVPRRFSLAMLLAMTALYAVLFGTMRALGTPTDLFVLLTVMFTAVAFGQPVLFGGKHPRQASIWIGGAVVPLEWLAWCIYIHFTSPADAPRLGGVVCMLLFCVPLGAGLGYLAGGLAAGIFVLADLYEQLAQKRKRRKNAEETDGDPIGQPTPPDQGS